MEPDERVFITNDDNQRKRAAKSIRQAMRSLVATYIAQSEVAGLIDELDEAERHALNLASYATEGEAWRQDDVDCLRAEALREARAWLNSLSS